MNKGLTYTLDMDASGFHSAAAKVTGSIPTMSSSMAGGMLKAQAAIFALSQALGAMQSAWGQVTGSISQAATREQLQAAFVPLLGSADAAQQRIAELAEFANTTPFELDEVSKASRVLETLTRGALSTGEGLRIVGDVAASTNQPFDEVATTIGRLYDGLDSGRPVGEALQRLQELGVVSGDTRSKLEDLQKSGKKGAEVWDVAKASMARFSGSMEIQSQTWNGKISTLSDAWSEVQSQFAKPLLEGLKPLLDDAIGLVGEMAKGAKQIGENIAGGLRFLIDTVKSGQIWELMGEGLKIAFGEAVNQLWKFSYAWVGTIGTHLAETFKNALMWFDILTDVSFWSGAAVALGSAIGTVVGKLMEQLIWTFSSIATPIMQSIGLADQAGAMNESIAGFTGSLKNVTNSLWEDSKQASGELWSQYGERITTSMSDHLSNVANKFSQGFASAGDVFDLSSSYQKIAGMKQAFDQRSKSGGGESVVGIPLNIPGGDSEPKAKYKLSWEADFVGSLAKVGGGNYGKTILKADQISEKQLTEQRKTNEILRQIVGTTAVFAR